MSSFSDHASKCIACRSDFEGEVATKAVVHEKLKPVKTPPEVAASILRVLRHGAAAGRDRAAVRLWHKPYVKPLLAFALSCAAIILLVTNHNTSGNVTEASFGGSNVILQSLANYRAMVQGDIKPQMMCAEPEHLKSFFSGKTEFPVLVPVMKECTLVGGVLNDYEGVTLAHVLYKRNGELVYMYQACWRTVKKGDKLKLPENAKSELEQTGWYTESFPDGNSVVMWTKGETLCSAVSHMPKENLIACLTSEEDRTANPW